MHYNSLHCNPGIHRPLAFVMVAQQPINEVSDDLERKLGRLALWHVANARQHCGLDRAVTGLLRGLELLERAVLILIALHDQDRNPDVAERFRDVPRAELRIEPGLAPGAECAIDIGVPAAQLLPKVSFDESLARADNLGEPHLD